MTCYIIYNTCIPGQIQRTKQDNRKPIGFMCGELGEHCMEDDCGACSDYLCDYPVGNNITCDRKLCNYHAIEVAPGIHYCDGHYKKWQDFIKSGKYNKILQNITPFNQALREAVK